MNDEYIKLLEKKVAALEAEARWIPCDEFYPASNIWVLGYGLGEVFPTMHSMAHGWNLKLAKRAPGLTHWRPLPAQPEEKEEK